MTHIPRAICGHCGRELEIVQTGVAVEMVASWGSYYKIYGDRYACTNEMCDTEDGSATQVILFAELPVAMNTDENYDNYSVHMHGSFIY